jgi:uncharacterized protein involved in exopolysaccharide biosynthesis
MRTVEASGGDPAQETLDRYLRIDLPRLLSWLRAGFKWILLCALLGLMAGVAYAVLEKPRYTVTTDILVDPVGLQIVADDLFGQDGQQRDSALLSVESKRQTLLSRSVLLKVVERLNLQRDPEFVPPPSWSSRLSLRTLLGEDVKASPISPEFVALDNLYWRVSARRDELSFVITMSVWTDSPDKSILISEAIVKAFREELVEGDAEGAQRTAEALTGRIAELKAEVTAAEAAVEAFRREHGLQSTQGELVSSRSMSQINQQLVAARERVIEAQSRYDELTAGNSADALAMQSATVSSLRTQYATLKSRFDADSRIYGPRHPRIVQQQIELRGLENEIEAERARIVQAARNNLDQAKAVVAALEADASNVSSEVFTDNDAQVRLRDLTREAAAKTAIYEAFLVRARQITEQRDLDTTNIRVISPPVPPKARSWPPSTSRLAGFGALAGMAIGVLAVLGTGIVRDMRTPVVRPAPVPMPPPETGPVAVDPQDRPEVVETTAGTTLPATQESRRSGSLLNMRSNSLLMYANDRRPDRP